MGLSSYKLQQQKEGDNKISANPHAWLVSAVQRLLSYNDGIRLLGLCLMIQGFIQDFFLGAGGCRCVQWVHAVHSLGFWTQTVIF